MDFFFLFLGRSSELCSMQDETGGLVSRNTDVQQGEFYFVVGGGSEIIHTPHLKTMKTVLSQSKLIRSIFYFLFYK